MVEEIRKLLRVEDLDRQVREANAELATFGPEREAAAKAVVADRQAVIAVEAVLDEREQESRELEVDLQDADQLVVKLDAQVYEVTSKQAMEAIQNELAAAKVRKSDLEDRSLEVLDAMELAATGIADAGALEAERAAERAAAEAARTARETALQQELERLGVARAAEAADVDKDVLRSYEAARRKAWPVLARAEIKSCPACRIVIPPQKWNEINTAKKIVPCGSCHRILYGDKVAAVS